MLTYSGCGALSVGLADKRRVESTAICVRIAEIAAIATAARLGRVGAVRFTNTLQAYPLTHFACPTNVTVGGLLALVAEPSGAANRRVAWTVTWHFTVGAIAVDAKVAGDAISSGHASLGAGVVDANIRRRSDASVAGPSAAALGVGEAILTPGEGTTGKCHSDAARIITGHAHDEVFDFASYRRSSRASILRAVKLLGDESSMPTQDGRRPHYRADIFKRLSAEFFAQLGQGYPLRIGEPEASLDV